MSDETAADSVSSAGDDSVERVGLSDADADAARTGADRDSAQDTGFGLGIDDDSGLLGDDGATDTDGEAVGTADADADARRSGADPDAR